MSRHALCLAWNWEYDAGFVRLLEAACKTRGLSVLQVTPDNLDSVLAGLATGEINFAALLDRASDSDPRFQPLADWALRQSAFCINPQEQARWSWDKAAMHLEFVRQGIQTPHAIILPPFNEQPSLPSPDLIPLGGSFSIKPASGGGGWGITLEAVHWDQVQKARQEHPAETMLLQSYVTPQILDGRPGWFRLLYCAGAVYPCWWDQQTHAYARVTAAESARFGLRTLREVLMRIAALARMHLFSTEVAATEGGRFLVVDYVNDPVDLRLQSLAADGVPDAILENIAGRLARLVEARDAEAV
jgi:hypothetical protein